MRPGTNPGLHGPVAKISSIRQSTGQYLCNAVATGAPMLLAQLPMIYHTSPGRVRHHDFKKGIQKVAGLPPTNERYINLFAFEDCADLTRRLGTLKYLMSPSKSAYDQRKYWR